MKSLEREKKQREAKKCVGELRKEEQKEKGGEKQRGKKGKET